MTINHLKTRENRTINLPLTRGNYKPNDHFKNFKAVNQHNLSK